MTIPANRLCSIARAVRVLGEKWNLLLIREAFLGRSRYEDFHRIGIPHSTLGQRLDMLVREGLLARRPYKEPGSREREEYVLTEMGLSVLPVLVALNEWGDLNAPLSEPGGISFVDKATGADVRIAFVDGDGSVVPRDRVGIRRRIRGDETTPYPR